MPQLGSNQQIALASLAKRGEHAPDDSTSRPWQFSTAQYRRILEGLVRKGLAEQLDSGYVSMTFGGDAARRARSVRFTPNFRITTAGQEALA